MGDRVVVVIDFEGPKILETEIVGLLGIFRATKAAFQAANQFQTHPPPPQSFNRKPQAGACLLAAQPDALACGLRLNEPAMRTDHARLESNPERQRTAGGQAGPKTKAPSCKDKKRLQK